MLLTTSKDIFEVALYHRRLVSYVGGFRFSSPHFHRRSHNKIWAMASAPVSSGGLSPPRSQRPRPGCWSAGPAAIALEVPIVLQGQDDVHALQDLVDHRCSSLVDCRHVLRARAIDLFLQFHGSPRALRPATHDLPVAEAFGPLECRSRVPTEGALPNIGRGVPSRENSLAQVPSTKLSARMRILPPRVLLLRDCSQFFTMVL